MVNFYSGFIVPEGARTMARDVRGRAASCARSTRTRRISKRPCGSGRRRIRFRAAACTTSSITSSTSSRWRAIDHVGLGSDFDGITTVPEQLEDVSCYPYITQELLNRGYKKEQIIKVLGGNLLRAMRKMEEVAQKN